MRNAIATTSPVVCVSVLPASHDNAPHLPEKETNEPTRHASDDGSDQVVVFHVEAEFLADKVTRIT